MNKDEFGNPKNKIIIGKDGIPMIVVPPNLIGKKGERFIQFQVVHFQPPTFTEIQNNKELINIKKILEELEKFFREGKQ